MVRATLQLPGVLEEGEALEPWPAQSLIAKALGISQPTVSQNQQAAVEQWAGMPWLGRVRDEVVAILTERDRVSTAEELAAELRAQHGAGAGAPAVSPARALAVVHAAVEAEIRKRDDDPSEAGLVARYREAGGRELLAGLQQAVRRPADTPHGLWLLLPTEDPRATPVLDGLFLKDLRSASARP